MPKSEKAARMHTSFANVSVRGMGERGFVCERMRVPV